MRDSGKIFGGLIIWALLIPGFYLAGKRVWPMVRPYIQELRDDAVLVAHRANEPALPNAKAPKPDLGPPEEGSASLKISGYATVAVTAYYPTRPLIVEEGRVAYRVFLLDDGRTNQGDIHGQQEQSPKRSRSSRRSERR